MGEHYCGVYVDKYGYWRVEVDYSERRGNELSKYLAVLAAADALKALAQEKMEEDGLRVKTVLLQEESEDG